ncbi:uncharacterized protein [Elaeis guineensis]|uniref:Prostatic spermine-binding protein isoform X1 n=2 Tax=Elaeis guineensis var. tenera TaxID=51953 RepID=A0A6I9QAV4_ELAGV|nr:prostatic spermine-binding protein isoform X1 [Elaeis guineensis]XP_010905773.1 prostatic spermine-binding protein isoform X1 [Elaeis guineensis]
MEASQPTGDAEECSSSESGWTMYLASPMHDNGDSDDHDDLEEDDARGEDDDDDGDGGGSNNNSSVGKDEGDEEDDDSMASDASTGRAHNKYSYRKSDGIKALDHPKPDEESDGDYSQPSSHLCRIFPKLKKNRDGKTRNPFQREAGSTSSQNNPKGSKPNLSHK